MRFLIFLFCLITAPLYAQEPSYITVGEEIFADTEIYDLIQDKNKQLLIATNQGVYRYDAYTFTKLQYAKENLSNSLFRFKADMEGEVYCQNLNGQIFQVGEKSLKLYYQVPDSIAYGDFEFGFTPENDLLLLTDGLRIQRKNEELKVLHPRVGHGSILESSDGSSWIGDVTNNTLVSYFNGVTQTHTLSDPNLEDGASLNGVVLFSKQDEFILFSPEDSTVSSLVDLQMKKQVKLQDVVHSFHVLEDNGVWFAGAKSGVYVMDDDLNDSYGGRHLYKDYFISHIYQDHQGNVILGTFGNGLLIIQNPDLLNMDGFGREERINNITNNQGKGVTLGTFSGNLYNIGDDFSSSVFNHSKSRVVFLQTLENSSLYLLGMSQVSVPTIKDHESDYELAINISAVKDVENVTPTDYFISSRVGLFQYTKPNEKPLLNGFESTEDEGCRRMGINKRTICAHYDFVNEVIYQGTSLGLALIDKQGNTQKVQHRDKPVIAKDIKRHQERMYIATQMKGILIMKNGEVVDSISLRDGLASLTVKQLLFHDNKLYIGSSGGFQIFDLSTKEMMSLGLSEGLNSTLIEDFTVTNDRLWLVTNKGVQTILLDKIRPNEDVPKLLLSSIFINDVKVDSTQHSFAYDENKLEFEVKCLTFKSQENIRYKYKLKGLEDTWQYVPFQENKIAYKSLPPNAYQLTVIPVFKEHEGRAVNYHFEIAPPFWLTWWFYVLIGFIGLLLALVLYRAYMNRQLQKARQQAELNASKLTAIRSQMNPHFIFNALNSIQDLVLKGDVDNSYAYITKFSNLVRSTLNYSDKEFIDLEDEINLIEVYLSLEKLRFQTEFEFEIEYDNVEGIAVPPMLIQPFIENALLHGLLHKEGQKYIRITLELEETLICTIVDNGIGRDEAMKIKNRQGSRHDSFSVNAIQQRFEILKQDFGGDLGFEYLDLMESRQATGTQVKLKIPIINKL